MVRDHPSSIDVETSVDLICELASLPEPWLKSSPSFHGMPRLRQEDDALSHLVGSHGEARWKDVAAHIPNRSPRQCRDRWRNYLTPVWNPARSTSITSATRDTFNHSMVQHQATGDIGTTWTQSASTSIQLKTNHESECVISYAEGEPEPVVDEEGGSVDPQAGATAWQGLGQNRLRAWHRQVLQDRLTRSP